MHETHQDNSLAFDLCPQCQTNIHGQDRFCRHCGVDLGERTALLVSANLRSRQTTRDLGNCPSPYATAPLASLDGRRAISAPLTRIVTTELTTPGGNRFARRLTLVLISFPIWLMMVLLSPLDAYAATKAIARQL